MTTTRQLITDRVPADFHIDTHVALGPWCFVGVEDRFPDWDRLPFIDPFPGAADRIAAEQATRALANLILDRLWPEMNRRHGTTHGRPYWHAVLTTWLLQLVQFSWQIYARVDAFAAVAGDEPLDVQLVEAGGRFYFADTADFADTCIRADDFQSWLIGQATRRLAPSHWQLSVARRVTPSVKSAAAPIRRRRAGFERVYGMGPWAGLMALYTSLLPKKPARRAWPSPPKIPEGYFPDDYVAFVDGLVDSTMPETLRTGFTALEAEAARHTYKPGKLRVGAVRFHDDQDNVVLGNAMEAGERIVVAQHGGVYGWGGVMSAPAEMEYSHDTFVSWGWREQQDYEGHFFPLPAPMLHREPRASSRAGIILVGTAMLPLCPSFDIIPQPLEYRRWKGRFVAELAPDTFANLRYRPYLWKDGLDDGDWMRRSFPELPIANDADLRPILFASRLVVVDHPITTLAVALSANIPTIAFWDKKEWPLARQAEPLFDELERAGILYRTPEEAAVQINSVWPRLEDWWQEPSRQVARARWCNSYARTDALWPLRWLVGVAEI